MEELTLHAAASGTVGADSDRVFAFLADLPNHWQLARRFVRVEELEHEHAHPDGAWIRLTGPLGVTRLVHTHLAQATPPENGAAGVLEGRAETRRGTCVRVVWTTSPLQESTRVTLALTVKRATLVDAALLRLGGRRWLERRLLRGAIDDLARIFATQRR